MTSSTRTNCTKHEPTAAVTGPTDEREHQHQCCPAPREQEALDSALSLISRFKCKMSNASHAVNDSASAVITVIGIAHGKAKSSLNCLASAPSAPLAVRALLCLVVGSILSANVALLVDGATTNHKQHRSAGLYAWNNFTDMQGDTAVHLNAEKGAAAFTAESPMLLPGAKTSSGCPPTTSSHCLRCNKQGCIKCPVYLVTDTRQCVDQCPSGYIDQWSSHTDFMGRVCVSTGYSGPLVAAIAGLIGGFLVCLSLLGVAVMMVRRRRRRKAIKQKLINENTLDRSDFLRQLNEMRPNAEYFLAMLNDTRRQIRKLYLSGEIPAANSYRPIVRDLAKLLILLNRPIELIPAAPHDWNRLYAWSEQALERYKPQVGQLIDFFQPPGVGGVRDDFEVTSVFQKGGGSASMLRQGTLPSTTTTQKQLHLFGSLISLHEFEEPRASDPFGSSFNTLKGGNLISDLNASSLWLEDEFYKLGFRPQDEITTEL